MLELNKPIKIFYANLLAHGIVLKAKDGQLTIGGPGRKNLSPAYRQEIERRVEHLVDMLSPEVPEAVAPYFHRLITVAEVVQAMGVAEQLQIGIETTPVNGGWIVLMGGEFIPAKPRKAGKGK